MGGIGRAGTVRAAAINVSLLAEAHVRPDGTDETAHWGGAGGGSDAAVGTDQTRQVSVSRASCHQSHVLAGHRPTVATLRRTIDIRHNTLWK